MRKITRAEWAKQQPRCFHCGTSGNLTTHEIVRGVHRSTGVKIACAWLRLCIQCHGIVDGWPIARQLALKKQCDFRHYDRVTVNLSRGRMPEAITEEEVDYYNN